MIIVWNSDIYSGQGLTLKADYGWTIFTTTTSAPIVSAKLKVWFEFFEG